MKTLYLGKRSADDEYEIGGDPKDWNPETGFDTTYISGIEQSCIERFIDPPLEPGELIELTLGKEIRLRPERKDEV